MKYLITLILVAVANLTYALSYTQEFTEAELQEKIEAVMPLEKKHFASIILKNPKLDLLEESNELSIKIDIEAYVPGSVKNTGTATISGSISYDPTQGTFHLINPKVVDLHIDNVLEEHQSTIKNIAQLAITNAMAKLPIYKLNDDNLQQKLAKSVLESVNIHNGKLLIKLNVL